MAELSLPRNAGHPAQIVVAEVTLTVAAAATTATATTTKDYNGLVWWIEIDPGSLTASATISGYSLGSAIATYAKFLDYTVPNPAVERVIYGPTVQQQSNAGSNVTGVYEHYAVTGKLKFDLASATAADSVVIRVAILG